MQATLEPSPSGPPSPSGSSRETELLRFFTAGSVDDGKSTLIGRLLHDSNNLYEDHFEAIRRRSKARGQDEEIDWALLTDGLKAEREQGITIDVAYRYFSTRRRKFIIADTPGHRQYTRNMATGASTADLGLILVDARHGLRSQSMRHTLIAHLLRVPKLLVVINKMDLVEYSQTVFDRIYDDFRRFWRELGYSDSDEVVAVPASALRGDNVVARSEKMSWYAGPSVLELLETIPLPKHAVSTELRFPVQYVARPNLDFRGYCGVVASGEVSVGDELVVRPSGERSRVKEIVTYDGPLERAAAPLSVTVVLEDEIDISRGDTLVHPSATPNTSRDLEATVVWMDEESLDMSREYLLKQTTRTTRTTAMSLVHGVDVETLEHYATPTLETNAIGRVRISTYDEVVFDGYDVNRGTGSFILIDPHTNRTVAAGMLDARPAEAPTEQTAATAPVYVVSSGDIELARALALALGRRAFTAGVTTTLVADPTRARLERATAGELLIAAVTSDVESLPAGVVRVEVAAGSPTQVDDGDHGFRVRTRAADVDLVAQQVLDLEELRR
ncbi:MAG: sulfate adenylyltransferase subunit CysN [Myxococcales bacterium FL481]|nr:MAG: sulfate adenylyltransferase subunit CysN [Myxococcales bacterium FL481]